MCYKLQLQPLHRWGTGQPITTVAINSKFPFVSLNNRRKMWFWKDPYRNPWMNDTHSLGDNVTWSGWRLTANTGTLEKKKLNAHFYGLGFSYSKCWLKLWVYELCFDSRLGMTKCIICISSTSTANRHKRMWVKRKEKQWKCGSNSNEFYSIVDRETVLRRIVNG